MEDAIADHITQATDISDDIARYAEMGLLNRLLKDRTTGRNIIWASNVFVDKGDSYAPSDEILLADITGDNSCLIRTRASKAKEAQTALTRAHAEVFTPTWIVKKMIDFADEAWWEAHPEATWQDYIRSPRLEITCGEAPYLTSRYDAADGTPIPVNERVGILDRKLRLVSENTTNQQKWAMWALIALKSTYGYEYQGDNLLIARTNVLATMEEFAASAGYELREWSYRQIVNVISWNLWQMDGLKGTVPEREVTSAAIDLGMDVIPGIEEFVEPVGADTQFSNDDSGTTEARLFDWVQKAEIEFSAVKGDEAPMRFDYVIGNPPYQEEQEGDNATFSPPIYHMFMDESREVSDVVELIHPGRFLFNAGSTPKAWNRKMLDDVHFKVIMFEQDCTKIFPNTDIKGGIAITLCDANRTFEPIKVFTAFPELNDILHRVPVTDGTSLASIVYIQNRFNLDALFADYPSVRPAIGSNGKDKRFEKNIFIKVGTDVFSESEIPDGIHVLGIMNNKRTWRYIDTKYVDMGHENINAWKVLVPTSNGSGKLGEPLSHPLVAGPHVGYTRSFIGIGSFEYQSEAEAALKYIKSKFCRTLLGTLKITQDNNKVVWRMIPLQDFTTDSDIDWLQSISDIDRQLYAKYDLSQEEVDFIESHVKEMQ